MKNPMRAAAALAAALLLVPSLGGCGKTAPAPTPTAPVSTEEPVSPAAPAETPEAAIPAGRQDGERFETVILLEGMEETVRYEHVRNEALGFEMDYDYETLQRISEEDGERFLSLWDDPESPENYLEVTRRPEDAEAAASAIRDELAGEYSLTEEPCELDGARECFRIDASDAQAGRMQTVFILPAGESCLVAAAHYTFESAEGFGHRLQGLVNTISLLG